MKNLIIISVSVVLSAVIIGVSLIIAQSNKQKSIERQQLRDIEAQKELELLKQETEQKIIDQKQREKNEARTNLDTCLSNASKSYSMDWLRACESLGGLSKPCIELKNMTSGEYINNNLKEGTFLERLNLKSEYDKKINDCSCELPIARAEMINGYLSNYKEECFKKYPQ